MATCTDIDAVEPPARGWWVRHGIESFGPYTESQMRAFVLEGRILADTAVRHEDAPDWQPAARHPGFAAIFRELTARVPPRPEPPGAQSPAGAAVPSPLDGAAAALPPGETATMAHVVYALYSVHIFTGGLSGIVGLVIAYLKRRDVRGTWLETHYVWQIRTFWIVLLGWLLAIILAKVVVGLVLPTILFFWSLWRIIKGWIRLGSNRPLADPLAWT